MQTLRVKQTGKLDIDREAGIIRGVSIITEGEARTHGYYFDKLGIEAVAKHINAAGGVPSRITHPDDSASEIMLVVGTVANARVEGRQVRGDLDLTIGEFCPCGNMKEYILAMAEAMPNRFGLSIVWDGPTEKHEDGKLYAKPTGIVAVDVVGSPAANNNGLLAIEETMTEAQLAELRTLLGLGDDADAAAILAAIKAKMEPTEPEEPPMEGTESVRRNGAARALAASAQTDAAKLAAKAERDRIAGLRKLAATHKLNETWVLNHAERGTPVLLAQQMAEDLAAMRQNNRGIPMSVNNVTVGADLHRESFRPALVDGLCLHAGIPIKDVHPRANEFRALRTWEVARVLLAEAGIPITGLSPSALITEARKNRHQLAMSSSDFDSILADTIGKTLRRGYAEVEKDWPKFCARAQAPDFKIITRAQLGAVPTPTERKEGAGVTFTTINDDKVEYRLAEYAQGIRITRHALINDDTDALSRIPTMQGAACARLEDDVAFAVLTANATMADGYALFSDEHSNLISTGNSAISVASLATTATKLAVQQRDSAMLALKPAALICRSADMVTAWQILNSTSDPTADLSSGAANPFRGALTLVANPRLDATGNAYWYLAAAPSLIEGIEVCFLADEPAPTIRQVVDDYTEDVDFLCRHTVAAAAIDYRAVVRNNG